MISKKTVCLLLLAGLSLAVPVPAMAQKNKKPEEKKGNTNALPPYFGPKKRLAIAGIDVKVKGITLLTALPSNPDTLVTTTLEFPPGSSTPGTTSSTGSFGNTTSNSNNPWASSSTTRDIEFGQGLADMLVTALIESNRFIVLERDGLYKIIEEQNRPNTATINPPPPAIQPSPANSNNLNNFNNGTTTNTNNTQPPQPVSPDAWDSKTVTAGRLMGAQVMIFASVTEMRFGRIVTSTQKDNGTAITPGATADIVGGLLGDATTRRSEAVIAMDIRMVDVSTGQIIDSVRAEGRMSASSKQFDIKGLGPISLKSSKFESSPLGQAVRLAIQDGVKKIATRMEAVKWQAKIAAIDTDMNLLYLNVGKDSGLKVGDVLTVRRLGKEIKDPDTGVIIGRVAGKEIGTCKVTQLIDSKITGAVPEKMNTNEEFKAGDVVEIAEKTLSSD
jgi:curli biogenesis system outer membrane secretion channel CsgG